MFKVIDVSTYQQNIDYIAFKEGNPGIKGVILRVGFTGYGSSKSKQMDAAFEKHYAGFKYVGLPIGVYWYSCAVTPEEAILEAEHTLEYIKNKHIDFPIWWDTEDNHNTAFNAKESQATIGPKRLTDCALAYCNTIEQAGYYVGIYASSSWFKNQLYVSLLTQFDKWVAHYGVDVPSVDFHYGMHQYTNSDEVTGISGKVDMNNCYKDYYTIIKNAGLNGWATGEGIPTVKTISADEVIELVEQLTEAQHKIVDVIEKLQSKVDTLW